MVNSVTKGFELFGGKWGGSQEVGTGGGLVTFNFAKENLPGQLRNFDSFILDENFTDEIVESFRPWEDSADIRFKQSSDSEDADIRFGWKDIDGRGGVLGETTVPSNGPLEGVIVALDVNEDWFLGGNAPPDKIDFSSTVTHEIGHAIGIDHSQSTQALMNAQYSRTIFDLQQDDIDAAIQKYGENDLVKLDVHRFFNPNTGSHFFTADALEKSHLQTIPSFKSEGIGFTAISSQGSEIEGASPVYRFYNPQLGSHLFTAFELEKEALMLSEDFVFEGEAFRAFQEISVGTVPVYRFFNTEKGGHFFTPSENERDAAFQISQFRFEGEAFYTFV